jgi:hypothetical protein
MMKQLHTSVLAVLLLVLGCTNLPQVADAEMASTKETKTMIYPDRLAPKDVAPVIVDRTSYAVIHWGKKRGLDQNGGYISATDLDSNKELWVLKVYDTEYDPEMEGDVQDVFIKSLSKVWFRNQLKVVNEREEQYLIDLKTRKVTRID